MKSFASSWRLQNVNHQFFKSWERDEDQKFWTSKVKVVSWSEDSEFLLQDFSEIGLQVPLPSVKSRWVHSVYCLRLVHFPKRALVLISGDHSSSRSKDTSFLFTIRSFGGVGVLGVLVQSHVLTHTSDTLPILVPTSPFAACLHVLDSDTAPLDQRHPAWVGVLMTSLRCPRHIQVGH